MSLSTNLAGQDVHFPKSDKFEFDGEVAEIFPSMAKRSIPLFYETHELHANLCADLFNQNGTLDILDVGASRGAFLAALGKRFDLTSHRVTALDISEPMCGYLREEFPAVTVLHCDVTSPEFFALRDEGYDIINCTYVVQFVTPDRQVSVLRQLSRMLRPGGLLFLGQKVDSSGPVGRMLHKEYIRFRVLHGYSEDEIAAKTAALQNSMWPMAAETLVYYLERFGLLPQITSQWTVFNNYVCTKGH